MHLPKLRPIRRTSVTVTAFGGLNTGPSPGDGEFAGMAGLTGDCYPALTSSKPRRTLGALSSPDCFLYWCRGLIRLEPQSEGYDRLYYRGTEVAAWRSKGLSLFSDVGDLSKVSAASIGEYVIFAPYRAWFNTLTLECGSMTAGLTVGEGYPGSAYLIVLYEDLAAPTFLYEGTEGSDPPSPSAQILDGAAFVAGSRVCRYYGAAGEWRDQTALVYRVCFSGTGPLPVAVTEGNEATLSGLTYTYVGPADGYDAESRVSTAVVGKVKVGKTGTSGSVTYVDLTGLPVEADLLLSMLRRYISESRMDVGVVTFGILGECPDLAYVCASDNRIWGCDHAGREIYACALGDPRSWYSYGTGAGSSWAATVGDGSEWTGAVTYRGRPCFFKRDRLIAVSGSRPANFGYTVYSMQGAASASSPAVVGDRLYFVGEDGVYVWSGGLAERISDKVGGEWRGTVGAGFRGKYYVCRLTDDGGGELLIYDPRHRFWHREEDGIWRSAAISPSTLYYSAALPDGAELRSFAGTEGTELPQSGWSLETGDLMRGAGKRYLDTVELTMSLDEGARCSLSVSYDGGDWQEVRSYDRACCSLPVRFAPHRCGSFRLKLAGTGGFTLYSLTRVTEEEVRYG